MRWYDRVVIVGTSTFLLCGLALVVVGVIRLIGGAVPRGLLFTLVISLVVCAAPILVAAVAIVVDDARAKRRRKDGL